MILSLLLSLHQWSDEHLVPFFSHVVFLAVYACVSALSLSRSVMSRVPCEARLQYLVEAETHYEQVLKIQQKVFGKRHQRSQRIELDLKVCKPITNVRHSSFL